MDDVIRHKLISQAFVAREKAYVPYSHFAVGAALLDTNGTIWQGCNIENAAYTPTNCAERTAFFSAIAQGVTTFSAIAICGGPQGSMPRDFCAPCGVCRQVMREFCSEETFRIILAKNETEYQEFSLKELFPNSFGPDDL